MTAKRVRLSPDERRTQLIALGVEMLSTRRLDQLSVEEIAASAGISRGLLFHYFASKHDFHVAVARAAAAELLRRTEPEPGSTAAEALTHSLVAFIDYVEQNPDNYRSLVRGNASGDPDLRAVSEATRAALAERVITVAAGLGLTLGPTGRLAVHGWVAYVEECVCRWIEPRADAPLDRDRLIALLGAALPALVAAAGEDVGALLDVPTVAAD